MISNFQLQNNKIFIKNRGEFYGYPYPFIYDIGNKLYEFAIMDSKNFEKLNTLYDELINIVCTLKECNNEKIHDEFLDKFFAKVEECLFFSPYTHFYTQTLIDIIVKTYDTEVFRTDLLFKYKIGVFIEEKKYYPDEFFAETSESPLVFETMLCNLHSVDELSKNEHAEYLEFFTKIKKLLLENFITKQNDLKQRLEAISEYSNNPLVMNLGIEERLFFYEAKRVFNLNYVATSPSPSIFLDTNFKTKYVSRVVTREHQKLSTENLISLMEQEHLYVEKVTEIDNIDDQIKFELLTIIENNFVINKCKNCGKLFIPITSSNNKNQKARTDQKYCDNISLDTGKTCKQIGALNKRKEKVENSPILKEFNKEYKRMYGLHYNHPKKFTEKQFKDWSKKAKKLTTKFTDEQVEKFKVELKNLSKKYWS